MKHGGLGESEPLWRSSHAFALVTWGNRSRSKAHVLSAIFALVASSIYSSNFGWHMKRSVEP